MTGQQRLERRIANQRDLLRRRLAMNLPIDEYYWGPQQPGSFGVGLPPKPGRPLLSQLLLTPHMIVDILPLRATEFIGTYGVKPDQMQALAEEGYVIPNMYHYKNEGWRDYLQHRELVALLADYGRPNTEWITAYLESRYGFSSVESRHADFFLSVAVPDTERAEVLAAMHGRIPTWERFATVQGQRLAYVEVLGRERFPELVERICSMYQRSTSRAEAIRILNAAYYFVARETTASYGGTALYSEDFIRDIRMSLPTLSEFTASRPPGEISAIPPDGYQFAATLVERARNLQLPMTGTPELTSTEPLTKREFKEYRRTLESVSDGRLGRLLEGMTAALTDPRTDISPVVEEYRVLASELDSRLRSLKPLASWLCRVGSWMLRAEEMTPRTYELSWVFLIGPALIIAGGALDSVEMVPLVRGGRPRRLFADWRSVKHALGI